MIYKLGDIIKQTYGDDRNQNNHWMIIEVDEQIKQYRLYWIEKAVENESFYPLTDTKYYKFEKVEAYNVTDKRDDYQY